MATTSSTISELYANIVSDLVPFYEDSVMLPNPMFVTTQFNIADTAGNTLQIPLVNSWSDASSVSAGASIASANTDDFNPTSASLTLTKKGKATDVYAEALEDGGLAVVQNQVITRLSRGLAQATDVAGFAAANTSFTNSGRTATYASYEANIVMSPEALAYGIKRQPQVSTWYNPDTDTHQFRATIRDGWVVLNTGFGRKVLSNKVVGFNVDIGIRNQNIFYSFDVGMESGKATSEVIQTTLNMVNQASGRDVATQNNSLWNLYKNRSYTCKAMCLGNALLQPTMYFNLRHVPLFYGPYFITEVNHSIGNGTFQTEFTGVRQQIYDLPTIDNYLQSINQNVLSKIEEVVNSSGGRRKRRTNRRRSNKNKKLRKSKRRTNKKII